MRQVAAGVIAMRDELRSRDARLGVVVDEVTVDFNVSASATDTSNLKLDLARTVPAGFVSSGTVSYSDQLAVTGQRSNHITIKLKNLATASLNDPGKAWAALCLANPSLPECQSVLRPRRPN
jgi:hypothetical protein